MKMPEDDRPLKVALQRYEIIAPLLGTSLPRGAQKIILGEIVAAEHQDLEGRSVTVGKRTIERYLANYRKSGLEGLKPQIRCESGSLRAFPREALEEAVKVRESRPELSADSIIEILRSTGVRGAQQMNVSTVNRHLRRLAKDRPSLKRVIRKRFHLLALEGAHELWICDVWDGPYLLDPFSGKKKQLRLVAAIDGYSRVIVHAQLYFNENRPCIEDTLMKAILKHQLPMIFYCDNARVFQSQHLKRIAAELGFRVKHSRPRTPQGRGRIERWFRTVAEKFEPLLKEQIKSGQLTSLGEVNDFFNAWLERRYHDRRHGTLKMSPRQALEIAKKSGLDFSRPVSAQAVREIFLWREYRDVSSVAAVKIYSNLYEVDESLVGKKVELRFNPYDLRRILVYYEGIFRGEANPYQMKNFTEPRVKALQIDSSSALDHAMKAIVKEHKEEIAKRSGLSFARAMEVKKEDE